MAGCRSNWATHSSPGIELRGLALGALLYIYSLIYRRIYQLRTLFAPPLRHVDALLRSSSSLSYIHTPAEPVLVASCVCARRLRRRRSHRNKIDAKVVVVVVVGAHSPYVHTHPTLFVVKKCVVVALYVQRSYPSPLVSVYNTMCMYCVIVMCAGPAGRQPSTHTHTHTHVRTFFFTFSPSSSFPFSPVRKL